MIRAGVEPNYAQMGQQLLEAPPASPLPQGPGADTWRQRLDSFWGRADSRLGDANAQLDRAESEASPWARRAGWGLAGAGAAYAGSRMMSRDDEEERRRR
jgi:hypothetical protein